MSNLQINFVRRRNQQHDGLLMGGARDVTVIDGQDPVPDLQLGFGSCSVGNNFGHENSGFLHSKGMTGVITSPHNAEAQRPTSLHNSHLLNGVRGIYTTTLLLTYMVHNRTTCFHRIG